MYNFQIQFIFIYIKKNIFIYFAEFIFIKEK